jgi:hypothetical protein
LEDAVSPAPGVGVAKAPVKPTDGKRLSGVAKPGATVVVTAPDGTEVGRVVADPSGAWTVTLTRVQSEGTLLTVTGAGTADPSIPITWRVGLPHGEIAFREGVGHENDTPIEVWGFQPGEVLTFTIEPVGADVGTFTADTNGHAVLVIPWGVLSVLPAGEYRALVKGAVSGDLAVSLPFVDPMPDVVTPSGSAGITGSGSSGGTAGASAARVGAASSTGTLPFTGTMASRALIAALASLFAGTLLLALRRKRSLTQP